MTKCFTGFRPVIAKVSMCYIIITKLEAVDFISLSNTANIAEHTIGIMLAAAFNKEKQETIQNTRYGCLYYHQSNVNLY